MKTMDPFSPPQYTCIHSTYNFLGFLNSFKPIYRHCHPSLPPPKKNQRPLMSVGLLERKEDGVLLIGILNLNLCALIPRRVLCWFRDWNILVTKRGDNIPYEKQASWHSDLWLVPCELGEWECFWKYQLLGLPAEDQTQGCGGEAVVISGRSWSAGLSPATFLLGRECDVLGRAWTWN